MLHTVVVTPFKVGLKMEQTRRENDHRVVVLKLAMCDTVKTLSLCVIINSLSGMITINTIIRIRDVAEPNRIGPNCTRSLRERLTERLPGIEKTINRCTDVCFNYKDRNVAGIYSESLHSLL